MPNLKVLFIVNAWPSNGDPGKGIHVKEQIESIIASGIVGEVFRISNAGGAVGYLREIGRLRRTAAKYDLIHAHHMFCGFLAILSGLGNKTIVSFMSDGKFNYKGRLPLVGSFLFHMTALFSRGNIFKCDFPRIYAAKSRYIPNGINTRHFNIIEKEKARHRIGLTGEKYILFVCSGNLADPERKIKRHDIFLEIVALLNKDAKEVWLPLTITNVPREEIVYYYNSADVLLVPSDVEGSPNVVKEALSCGLPVVGRNVGDIKIQLMDVPDCYIFSPDNLLAAVSHIKSLSNVNKEARRTSWLAKGYSAEAVSKQIIHFYHERNPN